MDAAVSAAGRRILAAMADMGHVIDAALEFRYDPDLRILGYSRPVGDGFRVVAGKGAFERGLLDPLLVHELSHVHRMARGHASHDNGAIGAAYDGVRLAGPQEDYHEEILHDAINNVQDLYADALAFGIMQRLDAVPRHGIGGFLLGWLKIEPESGKDERETRWRAAHAVLGNARALTQIRTNGSAQQVDDAMRINSRLLDVVPPDIAQAQAWFQSFFDGLPPVPSPAGFAAGLSDYVGQVVAVAEGGPATTRQR